MSEATNAPSHSGVDTTRAVPGTQLVDGRPVPEDGSHLEINPATGQQRDYVCLSPEERAKGFVKPVRRVYYHSGTTICGHRLGEYIGMTYGPGAASVCYGPPGHAGAHGYEGGHRVFIATAAELGRLRATSQYKGCGHATTMALALAETYARQPDFYGGTFCAHCGKHFLLNEFEWEDGEPMDPALQPAWAERRAAAALERKRDRLTSLRVEIARLQREAGDLAVELAKRAPEERS